MSFFSCTGKAKKKVQKFGLVDIFRCKVRKSQVRETESDCITKYVNELAEEQVSYKNIQKMAWDGVPHCNIALTQVSGPRSGNIFYVTPSSTAPKTHSVRKGMNTKLCSETIGSPRSLPKAKPRSSIQLTGM